MPLTQKHKKFEPRTDEYYNAQDEKTQRLPGEPRRIIEGSLIFDRSVFQHSAKERELLKLAKLQNKIDELKKK